VSQHRYRDRIVIPDPAAMAGVDPRTEEADSVMLNDARDSDAVKVDGKCFPDAESSMS